MRTEKTHVEKAKL